MGAFTTIIPSSTLASSYAGFPPDMDDWSCAQWKAYYLRNKAAYGQAKAVEIVDIDSERVGTFSTVNNSCKFDCEWLAFFNKEGLKYTSLISLAYCGSVDVVEAAKNTAGVVKNVTGTVESVTSNKGLLLAVLAIGGGLYLYHNNKK